MKLFPSETFNNPACWHRTIPVLFSQRNCTDKMTRWFLIWLKLASHHTFPIYLRHKDDYLHFHMLYGFHFHRHSLPTKLRWFTWPVNVRWSFTLIIFCPFSTLLGSCQGETIWIYSDWVEEDHNFSVESVDVNDCLMHSAHKVRFVMQRLRLTGYLIFLLIVCVTLWSGYRKFELITWWAINKFIWILGLNLTEHAGAVRFYLRNGCFVDLTKF
jgi:hypothetical protein